MLARTQASRDISCGGGGGARLVLSCASHAALRSKEGDHCDRCQVGHTACIPCLCPRRVCVLCVCGRRTMSVSCVLCGARLVPAPHSRRAMSVPSGHRSCVCTARV